MSAFTASTGGRKPLHLPSQFPLSSSVASRRGSEQTTILHTSSSPDCPNLEVDSTTAASVLDRLSAFTERSRAATTVEADELAVDVEAANAETENASWSGRTSTRRALSHLADLNGATKPNRRQQQQSPRSTENSSSHNTINNNTNDSNYNTSADVKGGSALTLAQRVCALTDDVTEFESALAADEGYFNDVAEVERCVMQYLREWRRYTALDSSSERAAIVENEDDSNNRSRNQNDQRDSGVGSDGDSLRSSRRASGLFGGSQRTSTRVSGILNTTNVTHSTTTTAAAAAGVAGGVTVGVGGGGSQRVQSDLDGVSQCIESMSQLHNALAVLEDEHRSLQRHYIVERTVVASLDLLEARLDELETESAAAATSTSTAEAQAQRQHRSASSVASSSGRGQRKQTKKEEAKHQQDALTCQTILDSLSACRSFLKQLRARITHMVDRLTDELLWMRAEVERHDWTVVQKATALTRMEPVVVALRSGRPSAALPHKGKLSSENMENENEESARASSSSAALRLSSHVAAHRHTFRQSGRSSSGNSSSNGSSPSNAEATSRDSFLLRVQVPVFATSTAPPLLESGELTPSPLGGGVRMNTNSNNNTRRSTTIPATSGVPDSGSATATNNPVASRFSFSVRPQSLATVSVVATPARYALVQLYETCRNFLTQMMRRLTHLRTRRTAEAEQLTRELSNLDDYDPATDELLRRRDAVGRYLTQLESWSSAVVGLNQQLHERVKVPADAALQTYEHFRAQLLEVLKQRLEQEDEEAAAAAAAAAAAMNAESAPNSLFPSDKENEEEEDEEEGQESTDEGDESATKTQRTKKQRKGRSSREKEEEVVDDEEEARARRSTQSPQAANATSSSPREPAHEELPRASAEFIGMLDTLLRSQQATAAAASAAAAAAAAVATTDAAPLGEASTEPSGQIASATAATTPDLVNAATCDPLTTDRELGLDEKKVSEDAQTRPSAGMQSSHLAGRRRRRDEDVDDVTVVEETATDAEAEPPISTASSSAHHTTIDGGAAQPDPLQPERDAPSIADSVHRTKVVISAVVHDSSSASSSISSSSSISASDSEDSNSESEDSADGHGNGSPAHPRVAERRRYGLGSDDGFRGGVRAFFSAVVGRMMRFDDSDSDVDEGRRSGRKKKEAGPRRKRTRHE